MRKMLSLLFTILLALTSTGGYFYLTDKVTSGYVKIEEGQKQLDQGEQTLADGKAKLESGEQRMAQSRQSIHQIKSIPFMNIVDKLPLSNIPFQMAHQQIAEGKILIAKGQNDVKAGEARLHAGQQQLNQGKEHLARVNRIRIICGVVAVILFSLSIVLGVIWRKSLVSVFKRNDSV